LTGQSYDYKRHGTTTLFAALEMATGRIIAAHSKRRRRVEFLGFMDGLVDAFPDRELHVILHNLNTHKMCRSQTSLHRMCCDRDEQPERIAVEHSRSALKRPLA
jgi:hypothetical protein